MIRQIIIPKKRTSTFEIPETFIGKKIEFLAFEVEEEEVEKQPIKDSFAERTKNLRHNSGNYKFNRLEANEYD